MLNTVPARVLTDAFLCCLEPETLLVELASAPGGFDAPLARNIGLRVLEAPGLPGRVAPEAAATLLLRSVEQVMTESEE